VTLRSELQRDTGTEDQLHLIDDLTAIRDMNANRRKVGNPKAFLAVIHMRDTPLEDEPPDDLVLHQRLRARVGNSANNANEMDTEDSAVTDTAPLDVSHGMLQTPAMPSHDASFMLQVCWSDPDRLTVITVDERDSLYPFTGMMKKGATSHVKAPKPVVNPDLPEGVLLAKILSGTVTNGSVISAKDHKLDSVVADAQRRRAARQQVFEQVRSLQENGASLGYGFWTETLRMELA